jgi:small-conductance mechanosensitive channel
LTQIPGEELSIEAVVELSDTEIEAIPQDKRVRIVQAQIEGGRLEIANLFQRLESEKIQNSELEFKVRELATLLDEERKRLKLKQKSNATLTDQLRQLRTEVGQQEHKLQTLGGDTSRGSGRDAELDKLANQLEREQANVLKFQAQIQRARNELASIELQYREETEEKMCELDQLTNEKRKLIDLINLECQKLSQLKHRNVSVLRGLASHTLDAQLTAVVESGGDGAR